MGILLLSLAAHAEFFFNKVNNASVPAVPYIVSHLISQRAGGKAHGIPMMGNSFFSS